MDRPLDAKAQAQVSTQISFNLHSPPTVAQVKFEFDKVEYEVSHFSSPSLASTTAPPSRHNQPAGDKLQLISKQNLVESGADYVEIFNELQIKPEHHDEIVTGILYPIRAKRIKNLKSATDAMIKELSYAFIRGYGKILYKSQREKWLIDDFQLRRSGKTRLQFTLGNYDADGPNAHLFSILEPMWWIMRGICFELKPPAKRRGQPAKKNVDYSDVWHGDIDTELEEQPHRERSLPPRGHGRPPRTATPAGLKSKQTALKMRFGDKQQQVLCRIEQEIDLNKQDRVGEQNYLMTANETDEAVQELIARLHEIHCKSDSDAFARSWETNLARLEEIEYINDLKRRDLVEPKQEDQGGFLTALVPDLRYDIQGPLDKGTALSSRIATATPTEAFGEPTSPAALSIHNLANEPFSTNGPPSPFDQLAIGQTPLIPSTISVYITTNPPLHPYKDRSYHWPDAPLSLTDCKRFFDGIDQRVAVRTIYGYVLSYGWNDVMRSVENHDDGRRYGFSVLRQDITDAAKKGVTKWRLKALVAGEALRYQRKV